MWMQGIPFIQGTPGSSCGWWGGYWTVTHWGTCRTVNLFYKLPLWFWGHLAMLVNLFYLYSCILLWDYICLTKKMWMQSVGNVHRPFCAFRPVYRLLPMSQCTYCMLVRMWYNIAPWTVWSLCGYVNISCVLLVRRECNVWTYCSMCLVHPLGGYRYSIDTSTMTACIHFSFLITFLKSYAIWA